MAPQLPGATCNAGAHHSFSLSSHLDPETFSYMFTPTGVPQGLRKVSLLGKLQSHQPAPGCSFTSHQPAKAGSTKPVTIPGLNHTHAHQALPHQGFHKAVPCSPGQEDDRMRPIIDPCSVLSPEVIEDEQVLGSWADRKIIYGFKPAAAPPPPSPTAEKDVPYGFIPRDFVLKEPSASAFWPEARQGVSTPIEAAAAFAQASRPAQRVAFNAACRVVVPNPSEVAKAGGPAAWPAHKPAWQARRSDKHLPVEERLWRLRAKRAWIREQVQALRGFPDAAADADYAEPWSEALALFEGMGGLPVAATGLEAQMTDLDSADTMGDDSALHDLVMFGEDDPAATPDVPTPSEANTAVICPSANGHMDMGEGTPDSMENVVPGMRIKELSPPVRAQQALPAQQALERQAAPGPMQPARVVQGFTPGNEGSHGILKKAQELMKYQRSIEAAMHQGWQSKLGESQGRATVHPKPKHGRGSRAGMLREDSAYEMYSGYRSAIKVGAARVVKAPAEQEKAAWAGALVPAVELDDSEAGDMIVVVVKLIDDRTGRSRVVQRGKADMSGSAVLSLLDEQLSQVAKAHNLVKPRMLLIRAGRVQWSGEE